ncbi:MAG: 3-keto-5-aminohexanoate cleavage protein [Hyphomicrobiales bacterium]|nr:3-keto-5-aminohexanoate cleavage protein [Hyphomicrobiales bacterium]
MNAPLIITAAPNGARLNKQDHPNLPVTVAETAAEAARCQAAGAAVLHAHVRDADGAHVLDPGLYRELIEAVRDVCGDMLVQITSEAVGRYSPAEQAAAIIAGRPEAASVALREMWPGEGREEEKQARDFYTRAKAEGIHIQHILYDPPDLARFADACSRKIIPEDRGDALFVLGRYTASQQAEPGELDGFVGADTSAIASWTVCAFGRKGYDCLVRAIPLGGHVRVGFENNLHMRNGSLAPDSAALVREIAHAASVAGRRLASPKAARDILRVGN